MNDTNKINTDRHLEKIELAMVSAKAYFAHDSEAKAALHITDRVLYSPVYVLLSEALTSLGEIKKVLNDDE